LCGRDLLYGGTWLGVHTTLGNFAALTNCDAPTKERQPISRGILVNNLISKPEEEYKNLVEKHGLEYSGFNIIYGNLFSDNPIIKCFSNRSSCGLDNENYKQIDSGVHAFSNGLHMTYDWPKTHVLKNNLNELLSSLPHDFSNPQQLLTHLQNLLMNDTLLVKGGIQNYTPQFPTTDQQKLLEYENQRIFIRLKDKSNSATRSQTVIIKRKNGSLYFYSRNTDAYPVVGQWEAFELNPPSSKI